jgi:antirestriction protein ArdC
VAELRAEIAAPFLASQLGIPTLTSMDMLTNHRNHVGRWVEAMRGDPALIGRTADAASEAVQYLLALAGQGLPAPPWLTVPRGLVSPATPSRDIQCRQK